MQKTIRDIIEEVKRQELDYGITDYTVYNYEKNYYQPIISFFDEHDAEFYSSDILNEYADCIKHRYQDSEISDHRFAEIKRCIRRIYSCAETGIG